MGLLEWHRKLWRVDQPDDEPAVVQAERRLGVSLPPLLREVYFGTSLRRSQMLHLLELEGLKIEGGTLLFALEQQATSDWGIRVGELAAPDPPIVTDNGGTWHHEGCTLTEFLRFYWLANRPFEPPSVSFGCDARFLKAPWIEVSVRWSSLQHSLWTNGEAVYEEVSGDLGARDLDALRRAIESLGEDPDDFDELDD